MSTTMTTTITTTTTTTTKTTTSRRNNNSSSSSSSSGSLSPLKYIRKSLSRASSVGSNEENEKRQQRTGSSRRTKLFRSVSSDDGRCPCSDTPSRRRSRTSNIRTRLAKTFSSDSSSCRTAKSLDEFWKGASETETSSFGGGGGGEGEGQRSKAVAPIKSCLKQESSTTTATNATCSPRRVVRFPTQRSSGTTMTSKLKLLRSRSDPTATTTVTSATLDNSTVQVSVHKVPSFLPYKNDLFWSQPEEHRMATETGLTQAQLWAARPYVKTYIQTYQERVVMMMNATTNTNTNASTGLPDENNAVLLLQDGRTNGFAGLEQFNKAYQTKRVQRTKEIIQQIVKESSKQKSTNNDNDDNDDLSIMAQSLTLPDATWALWLGNLDQIAAAAGDEEEG